MLLAKQGRYLEDGAGQETDREKKKIQHNFSGSPSHMQNGMNHATTDIQDCFFLSDK